MKLTRKVLQTVIDHLPCGVTLGDAQLNMLAYAGEFLRLLEFPPGPVEVGEPTFETFIRYSGAANTALRAGRGRRVPWGSLMAGALFGSLPVAILYSFFVEYYVSGLTGAVKE